MCSKTYWTFKSWLIWFPFFFIPYSISSTTSQLLIWFTIIPLFTLFFFTQTQINSLFFIDRFWLLSLFFLFPIDSFSFFNLLIRTFDLLIYSLVPFLTLALSYLVLFLINSCVRFVNVLILFFLYCLFLMDLLRFLFSLSFISSLLNLIFYGFSWNGYFCSFLYSNSNTAHLLIGFGVIDNFIYPE